MPIQETKAQSQDQEDPLEKETATHSSILAGEIPWTEEPGGLQSTESQRDVRIGPQGRLNAEELMLLNCSVGEDS